MLFLNKYENFTRTDYNELIQSWYDTAKNQKKNNPTLPSIINQLYRETEVVAENLKQLIITDPSFAQILANIILNSFAQHSSNESKNLAEWIGSYSKEYAGKDFSGPYQSFHSLFTAIAKIKNHPTAYPSNFSEENIPLSTLENIDKIAALNIQKFQFPPEMMNVNLLKNILLQKQLPWKRHQN